MYIKFTARQCLTHTLCIATDEDLRGRNVLHSLRVHSCASMLYNICSESRSKNEFVVLKVRLHGLAYVILRMMAKLLLQSVNNLSQINVHTQFQEFNQWIRVATIWTNV